MRNSLSYFAPQNDLSPLRVFTQGLGHLAPVAGSATVSLLVINPYLDRDPQSPHTFFSLQSKCHALARNTGPTPGSDIWRAYPECTLP